MLGLLGRLLARLVRGAPRTADRSPGAAPEAVPLTEVNKGLRDMGALLLELERRHKSVRAHGSRAWAERQTLLAQYHDTLRAVLDVLDSCESAPPSSPHLSVVREGLRRILDGQGVEPIEVRAGDAFDPRQHECEDTVATQEQPAGAVVDVLVKGYAQRRANGARVVLRPARVRVAKATETPETESR